VKLWLREFEEELAARHVRRPLRERLVAELADHLACEEGDGTRIELTRIGAARAIADQYADELASHDARRGAFISFAALAVTAVAMAVGTAGTGRSQYPGFNHGFSAVLALLAIAAIVFGSQVALVSGLLATWRALRRRSVAAMPAAEVALLRRRTTVALGSGTAVAVGLVAYRINFIDVQPAGWLALGGSLAGCAIVALAVAWSALVRSSATVTAVVGPAGDLYDDIPPLRPLRGHPARLCAGLTLLSGLGMTLVEWHAERSLSEGLQRGAVEALGFLVCFVALSRAIGARR